MPAVRGLPCGVLFASSLLAAGGLATVSAERLPVRAYSSSEGLGHDRVLCVVQDSRGLLWFCTADGLSRFDGRRFVNYGVAQGLPAPPVYSVIESQPGVYWVGANGGLARLDTRDRSHPSGPVPFVAQPLDLDAAKRPIVSLLRDRAGRLWAAGEGGLFSIDDASGARDVRVTPVSAGGFDWGRVGRVRALLEDHEGSVWVAAARGVVRRTPDGRLTLYGLQSGGRFLDARSLLEPEPGTVWIGTGDRLIAMRPEPAQAARGFDARVFETARPCPTRAVEPRPYVCQYETTIGPAGSRIRSLIRAPDGTIWIGAVNGLTSFDGTRFRTFTQANGLSNETINAITIDRAGSVWLGTDLAGAIRISPYGLTSFTASDGLAATDVGQIVQDVNGVLYAITLGRGLVHRFDGRAFHAVDLNLSRPAVTPRRPLQRPALPSRPRSTWWVDARAGDRTPPEPFDVNQTRLFAIFPHSSGDLWIGEHRVDHDSLLQWRHETATIRRFDNAEGRPAVDIARTFDSTLVFAEDARRGMWIGVVDGGVARFRDEHFTPVLTSTGTPLHNVKDVSIDPRGRVWIASNEGIWRVEDPGAAEPRASIAVQATSLGRIKCMTIDARGRLYIGTPNGVEQVDPDTGRIMRRYTRADGLVHNEVLAAFRDHSGALWFGTYEGVSRLVPPRADPDPPPPVFISSVVAAGQRQPIAELGQASLSGIVLAPDERRIQIDFGGLAFGLGDPLRFQHRLLSADRDWTMPDETSTVSYAQLSRGKYRFEVRAVTASGVVSAAPAVVEFDVLAPVWARGWFIALALGVVALGAHAGHRMRTARLVEVERIRTRIAADLHDDIGANLSRIAMMSDVAQGHVGAESKPAADLLASVAAISRESVDAMSDIVWAVDPTRDRLKDLAQRMRRFASDVLGAREIAVTFHVPGPDVDWPLGADLRREMLLIFKEAVNNVARHSNGTRATIELKLTRGELMLTVADNGSGFDAAGLFEGNGLVSMRRRAERLGGAFSIRSSPGEGTTVELRAPAR